MNRRITFTRGRKWAIGLNVLVASLLAPLAGGLLIYLAFRPEARRRIDLTSRQTFTLSERTQKLLDSIAEPIDVYTCFRPTTINASGGFSPGMDEVIAAIATHCNDLLREFELRSAGKVRLHAYDPNQTGHLVRITELTRAIGETALNVAVVERGARRRVLRLADLAAFDEGTRTAQQFTRSQLHGFRDEEALAKALLSVTEKRRARIGFLKGHGERNPTEAGYSESGSVGMGAFGTSLLAQNYELAVVDLSSGKPLAREELDVLVVADPLEALTDAEVETVTRYAGSGGRLLVMLSPNAANSLDFPLLDQLYGLARTPHPVCQETKLGELKSEPDSFFTDVWSPDHPIVQPLRTKQLRLHWEQAGPLKALGRVEQSDVVVVPLAWTGKDAWTDLLGADRRRNRAFDPGIEEKAGPYTLAVAIERRGEGGRAVVVGTASVFDNNNLAAGTANRDFALNAVDWLTSREQLISIAPRPFEVARVDLTGAEFRTIFLYVVVGIPALALLLGVAVFWARRN